MEDYYVTVDYVKRTVSISTYLFNCFYPYGIEKTLASVKCTRKSGYSLDEAKKLMSRICDVLNRTNWNRENDVYGKH